MFRLFEETISVTFCVSYCYFRRGTQDVLCHTDNCKRDVGIVILIDIFFNCNRVWHPVAVVQYSFTQKIHRTTQLTTLVGRISGIRTQSGQINITDELTV